MKAPRYGWLSLGSKALVKQIPKPGVFQESIIGSAIVNSVLGDLEKNYTYLKYLKKLKMIENYSGKRFIKDKISAYFLFLRVVSDILILGKGTYIKGFWTEFKSFDKTVKKKGLILKQIKRLFLIT